MPESSFADVQEQYGNWDHHLNKKTVEVEKVEKIIIKPNDEKVAKSFADKP